MPIRDHVKNELAGMNDRELVDAILASTYIDPEFMGEAVHRKLIFRGATDEEIYAAVEVREKRIELLLGTTNADGDASQNLTVCR